MSVHASAKFQQYSEIFTKSATVRKISLIFRYHVLFCGHCPYRREYIAGVSKCGIIWCRWCRWEYQTDANKCEIFWCRYRRDYLSDASKYGIIWSKYRQEYLVQVDAGLSGEETDKSIWCK
jgi:hypothetical protein